MEYAAFLQAAERGQPPPLALLHGPDEQLLEDALGLVIRGLFADASELALGREVLEGDEVSVETIVRSAMTLPLMTRRRLVVVRRAHALGARGADTLTAYAGDPNPTTCLLLLADEALGVSRERRTEHWLLAALPPTAIVALPLRKGRALEDWLKQRAAADELVVTDEAARLLVQWVGEDGARLLGEARKAALAGGPENRKVGVNEVTAIVGEHRLGEVFELTRAVERRDLGLALRTLDHLLATEEPVFLLALLTRSVRQALTVRDLAAAGQSVEQIARLVRPTPPPVVEAILARVSGAAGAGLSRQLARCWQAEWRCKSGGQARAELTALVADLCRTR
ncbi:MAG: DNA polymerase III subunit delta [Candidatus Rokuibacteriota bacterium]|nr:MAG: DNA polymerase III subunit delta [Candidatus Rokubacteria bacterium]